MRSPLLLCIVISLNSLWSQDSLVFTSPINYTTVLSGSYAEPRTAHFHAGIDFKQKKGVPFDSIYAIGDGYISRINVKPDGYGNALYINHPNGYTSVYAHLHQFEDKIKEYIEDILYKKRKHQIVHHLDPGELTIKKGDFVGFMGNTGRSSAPHLHFELRETESENSINPALFGFKPEDSLRPTINGVVIYSIGPDGAILSKEYHKAIYKGQGNYSIAQDIIHSGAIAVGVGLHCYDTMNGASNHNGIYGLESYINDELNYSFQLDQISFDNSHYIHSHMDYSYKKANRYVSKCFRADHNPLNIYKATASNGIIPLSEKIPSHIKIRAYDIEGNDATIEFALKRKKELKTLIPQKHEGHIRIIPTKSYLINGESFSIEIDSFTVDNPQYMKVEEDNEIIDISSNKEIALFEYVKLSYTLDSTNTADRLIFSGQNDKGEWISYGAKKEANNIYTYINHLGKYKVTSDTIAPIIKMIQLPSRSNQSISFVIDDNYDAIYNRDMLNFELLIDGQWVLCQHDIKTNKVWHKIVNINKGQEHNYKIIVRDGVGNTATKEGSFSYQ